MVRTRQPRKLRKGGGQPSLFAPEVLYVPEDAEGKLLFFTTNAHAEALRRDERQRGTGRNQERTFREALAAFASDYAEMLPPLLYELILDHLTRTDMMGLSLCFHGPVRQTVLTEVSRWLDEAQQPAARTRWAALAASQKES